MAKGKFKRAFLVALFRRDDTQKVLHTQWHGKTRYEEFNAFAKKSVGQFPVENTGL